jgi:dual specificity MAP kinase phosphatase
MSLPEAYLELQIARGRSFYVYPSDLDLLKRAEARLYTGARDVPKERGREREVLARTTSVDGTEANGQTNGGFSKWKWSTWGSRAGSINIPSAPPEDEEVHASPPPGIASALIPMLSSSTPNASSLNVKQASTVPRRRARASTTPMPHVWADHWAWFSDPRFDGSFPSRVLPFLYLGNL